LVAIGGILKILSSGQIEEIHNATLQVLEETGCVVLEENCLRLLADAGALVDFKENRAFIPSTLIESSLKKAPSRFTWHGRDPGKNILMEGDKVHYGPVGGSIYVIDLDGNRRPTSIKDAKNFVRIIDSLENIHEGHCMVHPLDVPNETYHVHMMLAMARNTGKPFRGRLMGEKRARDCIKIAEVLAGGSENMRIRPNLACHVNTFSPLCHGKEMTEGLMEYAKAGLPVFICPEVMAGGTGPVSLAGTLVVQNAEVLSGLVIAQLIHPGTPVVYGTVSTIMDFSTMNIAYGAIEQSMLNIASAQMAKFYRIPCRGTAGITDSNLIDIQAGIESATSILCQGLAGINFIHASAGGMEGTVTASYEKLIIDDEIIGRTLRFLRGIDVSEKSLALDVIHEAGPRGNYFAHSHTVENYRKEHFLTRLSQRNKYDVWLKKGENTLSKAAHEKARDILRHHTPRPLEEKMEKELLDILKSVEKRELK
jgi:trimethylamine---corrinoid protein Co-methyltransferase